MTTAVARKIIIIFQKVLIKYTFLKIIILAIQKYVLALNGAHRMYNLYEKSIQQNPVFDDQILNR